MSRRQHHRIVGIAIASAVSSACIDLYTPAGARNVLEELHEDVRERVASGNLARPDGFVYTVDIAQLMTFAALERDLELYQPLRDFAVAHFVQDVPEDPYTRGFVLWRYGQGVEPDASGTTEALRLAEGLWRGAEAFDRPEDREWAIVILDGYARHAATEQGVWMIRNYFNLGTRSFANNSFLVDYAPDFVSEVAEATGDEALAEIAERSYRLVRQAQLRSGLLYDVVQPEIATLFDDDNVVIFSPNDRIQLSNAATVVAQAARGEPILARKFLHFCMGEMPHLSLVYFGRTSEVARSKRPGIEVWSSLVRIAVALEDAEAVSVFFPYLVSNAGRRWNIPKDAWLYVVSELLLGLQAVAPEAE